MLRLILAALVCAGGLAALDPCLPHGCTNYLTGQCWADTEREGDECYDCYEDALPERCSVYKGDACVIEATANHPVLLQAYWQQHLALDPSDLPPPSSVKKIINNFSPFFSIDIIWLEPGTRNPAQISLCVCV